MGLISAISDWNAARYEKRLTKMKSQGICPECSGAGVTPLVLNEFIYTPPFDCQGCTGSGLYSDWAEMNQQ